MPLPRALTLDLTTIFGRVVASLRDELKLPYWVELEQFVATERTQKEVYPAPEITFAAFKATPFKKVRVVILGQDPYPNPGDATGLAFAVPPGHRPPTSLANIHAALRASSPSPMAACSSTSRRRKSLV